MQSDTVILIDNISKCYRIYDKPQDRLKQYFFRDKRTYHRDFWALRDVGFGVQRGEVVGIVGRNGAGKSTLLQIICGTLSPTQGVVSTTGRISALLELGSGFNKQFTGRENIYLNGAILGLENHEIESRLDEIIEFSELEQFIDQPLTTYSSGMILRLAFAVGISVEPSILVIDEALAVGDAAFQRKCFSKIQEIKDSGASILFVSHASQLVVDICDRAILLDRGELLTTGRPNIIMSKYQQLLGATPETLDMVRRDISKNLDSTAMKNDFNGQGSDISNLVREDEDYFDVFEPDLSTKSTVSSESRGATIQDPMICTPSGKRVNVLRRGSEYILKYNVKFDKDVSSVRCGMHIKTVTGFHLGGSATSTMKDAIENIPAGTTAALSFRFKCLLFPGAYFINVACSGLVEGKACFLHRIVDALVFKVQIEESAPQAGIVDFGIQPAITLAKQA